MRRITEMSHKLVNWTKENHLGSVCAQLLVLCFLLGIYMDSIYYEIEYANELLGFITLFGSWFAAANEARRFIMKPLRAIKRAFSKFW